MFLKKSLQNKGVKQAIFVKEAFFEHMKNRAYR